MRSQQEQQASVTNWTPPCILIQTYPTTPAHETHIYLVISCMQAGRIKQVCETTLQVRLQAISTLHQVAGSRSKRRMWHFKVELLRLI